MVQIKTFEFKVSCAYGSGEFGLMAWKDKAESLAQLNKRQKPLKLSKLKNAQYYE